MPHMPTQEGPSDVISLACARFEDALAEGALTPVARAHAVSCPRCAALAADLTGLGGHADDAGLLGAIQRATGPAELPPGFADAVLARALPGADERAPNLGSNEDVAAATPLASPPSTPARTRWWGPALVAGLAAGLAVTAGAALLGGFPGATPPTPGPAAAPQRVTVAVAADATASGVAHVPTRGQGAALQPTRSRALDARASHDAVERLHASTPLDAPARPGDGVAPAEDAAAPQPRAALPRAVPEPSLDVPRELRAALVREVRALDGCPAHTAEAVRVTLTVTPDGALTNRQVLSMGGDATAHLCVNRALDRLLLPPLDRAATVTLDLRW